jgi:PAS domain S-box-containing protein
MIWLVAGGVYVVAYVAAGVWLAAHPLARLWTANLGLLIPPLVPAFVVLRRRRRWRGRHLVFWDAIAAGALLWFGGQVAWAVQELLLGQRQPWLAWEVIPQLCGSMIPVFALVAWPHRGQRRETTATTAIDLYALVFVAAFLVWTLAVAPGLSSDAASRALAVHLIAVIGPGIRFAGVVALAWAAWRAGGGAWRDAYTRLAIGAALAFVLLVVLSSDVFASRYETGSPFDAGWILPFFCWAWAAASAPPSPSEPRVWIGEPRRPDAPVTLFTALAVVPVVGYGIQYVWPLGGRMDHVRGIVTALTLTGGLALVMTRVIVERWASEAATRRLRLLAAALEQNKELVVIARGEKIRYANEAFCASLGYTPQELERTPPSVLVAPDSREELQRIVDTVNAGHTLRGTMTLTPREGPPLHAGYVVAPLVEPVHGTGYRIWIFRDLAEEIQLREQVVKNERLSAVSDLVIGVAHELNNPLQSVIGHLDLVMTHPIDPAIREDLDRVRFEATRAGRILRNLLAFVRKSPQQRMLGELNELVRGAVARSAYELSRSSIDIHEAYDPGVPLVLVNHDELQQLVGNLLVNAQQSILSTGRPGHITVRTRVSGTSAVLEVEDDGAGVPPEARRRIFEPFFTTKEIGQSSGLGLSIAFGIATAHGGTLELAAAPAGACFRLTLPGAGFAGPVHGR